MPRIATQFTVDSSSTTGSWRIIVYKSLIDDELMNKTTCLNLIDSEHGFRPSMKEFTDIINGRY